MFGIVCQSDMGLFAASGVNDHSTLVDHSKFIRNETSQELRGLNVNSVFHL